MELRNPSAQAHLRGGTKAVQPGQAGHAFQFYCEPIVTSILISQIKKKKKNTYIVCTIFPRSRGIWAFRFSAFLAHYTLEVASQRWTPQHFSDLHLA